MDFVHTHGTSVLIPEDALLIWDNHRMFHARTGFSDTRRRLTHYWIADHTSPYPGAPAHRPCEADGARC
ncbi:TauD/TfdA family dioxygenase [Streptomyces sp. MspMP-M5]|uniref:TauD/TfdA family dioxygenase n=1 Tax=unclassified Streptomyces TaxID=2593676 RepID=UPI000382008F|nr:TauD/TfdA family dioxygenase [Streptomyces sp. MspMP-M5]